MTKAFTQSEKDQVRLHLLKKGREYFIKYGFKKTSIDELVGAVGIAKGSFYNFFDSKEAFFLAVHEVSEEKLKTDLISELEKLEKPADKLREFFKRSFAILEDDPLMLAVFGKGELESISGFMSSRQYEEHYREDITFIEQLFRQWQEEGIIRQLDAEVAGNMVASAFFIFLQKETLGEEMYNRVIDMLIECMVSYMSEKS